MSKYLRWKAFEAELARAFKKAGFDDAKRNWSEQFDKKSGRDLINTEPYVIQAKYTDKKLSSRAVLLVKAWTEANTEKKKGEIPIGIVRSKKDRNTLAVLSFKDFMWLVGK